MKNQSENVCQIPGVGSVAMHGITPADISDCRMFIPPSEMTLRLLTIESIMEDFLERIERLERNR